MTRAVALALVLAVPAAHALAAGPANPVPARHQAVKDAKAKLDGQFAAFVDQVKACSPPAFMNDVINGFTGPGDSAKNLLELRTKAVEGHVSAAELKFTGLGDLQAACRSGGFEAKAGEAEAIANEAKLNIEKETKLYEEGQKVALGSEGKVRQILGARLRTGVNMVSSQAQVDGCKAALAMLGDDGKNNGPLRDADKDFREKLGALKNGYTERVASLRDFGRQLASASACGPAQRRAGLFPAFGNTSGSDRSGEFQVADIPVETDGVGSAR